MELRPTTVEDLPSLHALFLASIGELYRRHAFDPPEPPLRLFTSQQAHLIATGRSVVAVEGDAVQGFAASWRRSDDWYLASLFVAPGAQSRGVGSRLLDAVWDDGALRRRTITDAIQPVSNALYLRRGLVPATPVLTFTGVPRAIDGCGLDGGTLEAAQGEPGVAAIDAAAYGFDRALDHGLWQEVAARTLWLWKDEPVAYSYAFPGGSIGPVAGLDPEAAASALAGALGRASGAVTVRIPGSSRALVDVALKGGLQLTATPGLLLLSEHAQPPAALALSGFTLF